MPPSIGSPGGGGLGGGGVVCANRNIFVIKNKNSTIYFLMGVFTILISLLY